VVESISYSHRGEFFDIQVPNAHHYFAEGAVHHNSGKTFTSAAWAYTFWKANFVDTSIYLSTTDMGASEARGWGTIKDLFDKDHYPLGKKLEYKHTIISPQDQEDKNQKDRDYRDAITAVAAERPWRAPTAAAAPTCF